MRGSYSPRMVLIAGAALVAACADATNEGPTATPNDAQLAASTATCDYTALRRDARNYLSNTDPILDLIRALQDARRGDQVPAGMDVLARLAAGRNEGIANDPAVGASLALGTLTCIGASPLPSLSELTSTLATDANGGVFEVLAGAGDPAGPAVAANAVPLWGAEPQPGKTWATSTTQRFVLFAYRITFATFTNEDPALLDPQSTDEFGTAFEMRSIPANVLTHHPFVGVCVEDQDHYRMQWQSNILARHQVNFCDPGFTTSTGSERGGLLAAAQRAVAWLAPKPLHAAAMLVGGTAGLPSGFTPFGAVNVSASSIALTIDPIAGGKRNKPVTITVRAKSANGNPVDNVLIKLSVAGNNGVGSDGEYELIGVQGPTANGGVVTFVVNLDKAGGYTVRADGYFNQNDLLPTLFAISNRFNLGG